MASVDIEKIKSIRSVNDLLEFSILNVDKPSGMTSFDVVEKIKKILKLRKTSHFGTLDPMVTGVLPVALNRACKLTGYFIGHDKVYEGVMRFHEEIDKKNVEDAIEKKFIGKIKQMPPVRSRVKRALREREVKRFEITRQEGKDFTFVAEVQGGTYIRKLVHDLGEEVGVGAHMIRLRRLRAGIFSSDNKNFITLEKLEKLDEEKLREYLIPAEIVSEFYEIVQLKREYLDKVLHGTKLRKEMIVNFKDFNKDEKVCVFCGDQFVEIAKVTNEKEVWARPEFVLQPMR
jgi:H/ACA ribonucleoprotein complex subunit 4